MASSTLSANSQNVKKFGTQQKFRTLVTVLVVGVPIFLAMLSFLVFKNTSKKDNNTQTTHATVGSNIDSSIDSDNNYGTDYGQNEQIDDPALSPAPSPAITSTPQSPNQQNPVVQQPIQGTIPAGVQTAINSIEANGVKGSPYVSSSMDTSQIPPGTSLKFDTSSWSQYSDSSGSVNATANILGTSKAITVSFTIIDGSWKASGYGLQ